MISQSSLLGNDLGWWLAIDNDWSITSHKPRSLHMQWTPCLPKHWNKETNNDNSPVDFLKRRLSYGFWGKINQVIFLKCTFFGFQTLQIGYKKCKKNNEISKTALEISSYRSWKIPLVNLNKQGIHCSRVYH